MFEEVKTKHLEMNPELKYTIYQWSDQNLMALRPSIRHSSSIQRSESQVSIECTNELQFHIFCVWDVADRQLNIRRVPQHGCGGDVF